MPVIMWLYYGITVLIVAILIQNFRKSDGEVDELVQYLMVCVPLILRLLRIK